MVSEYGIILALIVITATPLIAFTGSQLGQVLMRMAVILQSVISP